MECRNQVSAYEEDHSFGMYGRMTNVRPATQHSSLHTIVYVHRDACLCSSILLTRNKLVSRKRSTQLERQLDSEDENLVEGVPVTHLSQQRLVRV